MKTGDLYRCICVVDCNGEISKYIYDCLKDFIYTLSDVGFLERKTENGSSQRLFLEKIGESKKFKQISDSPETWQYISGGNVYTIQKIEIAMGLNDFLDLMDIEEEPECQ